MAGGAIGAGEGGAPSDGVDQDPTLRSVAPGPGFAPAEEMASGAGAAAGTEAGVAAPRRLPVAHAPRRLTLPRLPRVGGPAIVAALVLLALVGAGTVAAAYFLLPEAHITVTPRVDALDPLVLDVTADPDATATDPTNAVVPAAWLETTVDAQDTIKASGVKVAETKATGSVTFSNRDIGSDQTVPAGATVKTKSGVAFRTDKAVTIPNAHVQQDPNGNLILVPGRASVGVTAAAAGTAGNVAAGTITVAPKGYNPNLLKVTNPKATSGGTHTETKVARQSDYDAGVAALTKSLKASFADWLASGPEGTAIRLDDTATLGDPTFDTPASDIVGKEIDAFDLAGHADGRVLTVDPALLDAAGSARFRSGQVPAGYALVESSVAVQHLQIESSDPAKPRFELTVSGKGYRQLDPAALERLVLGKPVAEARATLSTYGDTVVTLSPGWFGTIPQLDWRVSLQVLPPSGAS